MEHEDPTIPQKYEIDYIECSIYTMHSIYTLEGMIVHANVGCVARVEPIEPMNDCDGALVVVNAGLVVGTHHAEDVC